MRATLVRKGHTNVTGEVTFTCPTYVVITPDGMVTPQPMYYPARFDKGDRLVWHKEGER